MGDVIYLANVLADSFQKKNSEGKYVEIEGTDLTDIETKVSKLMKAVFKLSVTAKSTGFGKYEVGDTVSNPTMTLTITRDGEPVTGETIETTPEYTSYEDNKITWPSTTKNTTYTVSVTQDGETVKLSNSITFTHYRYWGMLASKPTDISAALKNLSKELSTSTSLSYSIEAEKYFLMAVQGEYTFKVYETSTGYAVTSGFDQGACAVDRVNGTGSDTYSYILIYPSQKEWSFKIS